MSLEENKKATADTTSVRHTTDSSLSRSYMLKIVRCLNERTNINKEICALAYFDAVNTIYYQRWRLSRKTINLYFAKTPYRIPVTPSYGFAKLPFDV